MAKQARGKKLPEYTLDQVAEHRGKNSLWLIVKNEVYDVTKFLDRHPGGEKVLLMAGGQDVTFLMETSHPFTRSPWKILEQYKIGTVKHPFVAYADDNPFYETVKQRVHEYFERNRLDPKDPWPALRTFLIIVTLWSIGYYFSARFGYLWAAAILGVSRALFGINTMHAASHFAISHKPWVWEWVDWMCFDLFMGGSSLAWNYQHVIGHHQHTNVFKADPDLPVVSDGDMRRVFSGQKWKWVYKFQAFYLPVLYTLLAFKTRYYDILLIFGYTKNGNLTMNVRPVDRIWQLGTKIFFVWYQFLVPLYIFGLSGWQVAWVYCIADLAAGTWLAYFFQVNHISDEVYYSDQDAEDSTTKKEWAQLQIEGTVDYAHDSSLFAFLSGTLNFQAVHHLFPSVGPHHYPAIAPIVKKAAKEYNVHYQVLPNFPVAIWHHFKELHKMGQLAASA